MKLPAGRVRTCLRANAREDSHGALRSVPWQDEAMRPDTSHADSRNAALLHAAWAMRDVSRPDKDIQDDSKFPPTLVEIGSISQKKIAKRALWKHACAEDVTIGCFPETCA